MKYKKLSFLVGILFLITVVTTGASLNDDSVLTPKRPGHMTEPYPNLPIPDQVIDILHRIPQPINSPSQQVIDMLGQLTEPLYLSYLENLTAFGPRATGTQACWDSGDWIYDQFEDMGLQVRYQNWSYSGYSGSNIEATIPGTDPDSDEIYLVCAHYDSVSSSPGADDDGSGTVAAMTAAYIMRNYQFNHTLRFVTFSGEEQGLLGSHEYVVEAYNNGDNIIGALNADMIGFALTAFQGSNLIIFEDESDWLYYFSENISEVYDEYIGINALQGGFSWGSDHYYFWEYGYDALFYHEYEFNHFYHSPDDIIANMNITYAVKSTRLILATLAELADAQSIGEPPEIPTITAPTEAIMGVPIDITLSTIDPEGDQVYYYINWDDGTTSDWIGPFDSGESVEISNIWYSSGNYEIKARAKDIYSGVSGWSTSHFIDILAGPLLNIEPIQGGILTVSTTIQNSGEDEAQDVQWDIAVNGGFLLLNGGKSGTLTSIPASGSEKISSGLIFGIGEPLVSIEVSTPEGNIDQHQQGAKVFLFFIQT